mmetsp:Transcript_4340/g.6495  ORF Transcript_4340/g.6495 Transcript_4340/m.6495 type:complete len:164 (-) Transcript_4340:188-679(-)
MTMRPLILSITGLFSVLTTSFSFQLPLRVLPPDAPFSYINVPTFKSRAVNWKLQMSTDHLVFDEENVEMVLEQARQELGTLFGYLEENRKVGITGEVELVELDGPCAIIRLKGRFWHERSLVLARVANFIQSKIPECVDVEIEDPAQLDDADPKKIPDEFDNF